MAAYEDVEVAVYKWFLDTRSRNIVSGPVIEQKAKDFAFLLNRRNFKGGAGWLQHFKERHSIVGRRTVTSQSRAVDVSGVQKWIDENWSDISTRLIQGHIYKINIILRKAFNNIAMSVWLP